MKILEFIIQNKEAIITLLFALVARAIEKPKAEKKAYQKGLDDANK